MCVGRWGGGGEYGRKGEEIGAGWTEGGGE